jgi:regulation of enolase protein 1 (concanavalin A-like superfamily)
MNGRRGFHRAGLILTDGTNIVRLERFATAPGVGEEEMATFRGSIMITVPPSASGWFDTSYLDGPPLEKPANLRLERRGSSLMFAWGQDGKEWTRHPEPYPCKLPHRLKIGVVAESTAAEVLKAEFSDFKLSLLKK